MTTIHFVGRYKLCIFQLQPKTSYSFSKKVMISKTAHWQLVISASLIEASMFLLKQSSFSMLYSTFEQLTSQKAGMLSSIPGSLQKTTSNHGFPSISLQPFQDQVWIFKWNSICQGPTNNLVYFPSTFLGTYKATKVNFRLVWKTVPNSTNVINLGSIRILGFEKRRRGNRCWFRLEPWDPGRLIGAVGHQHFTQCSKSVKKSTFLQLSSSFRITTPIYEAVWTTSRCWKFCACCAWPE